MPGFVENPFAALDKKQFRTSGGKKNGQSVQRRVKSLNPEEDGEDARLFLQAVQHVEVQEKKKKGFILQEQQAFEPLLRKEQRSAEQVKALEDAENTAFQAAMQAGVRHKGVKTQMAAKVEDDMAELEQIVMAEADSDLSAFSAAMQKVTPLSGKGRGVATCPTPKAQIPQVDAMDGKLEFAISHMGEYREGYVVGLDERIVHSLRAGSMSPEAYLDLHGLTVQRAFQALLSFVRQAWYKGLRTVLIVPGRGLNSPSGYGILRDRLQLWLTQEPFKRVVLAFCTARPADGGPGSMYVLLRKYRKKGQIYWDRLPEDADLL